MMGLQDVKLTTVKLADSNDNLLELLHFHSHPDKKNWVGTPYSTGLTHIAITVSDLDTILNQLISFGCPESPPAQLSLDGNVRVVYASGPEGLILELVEPQKN